MDGISDENGGNRFRMISFDGCAAIRFVGFVPDFEHTAFRVLREDGTDFGYVCEFAPHTLRTVRVFPCVSSDTEGGRKDDGVTWLCRDERIVATLLCLAYPKGVMQEVADFARIEKAEKTHAVIPLMSEDDARQVVSYAPFDEEWLRSRLEYRG